MSTFKAFFKDTFIYGIASVMPRLINFALVPVITNVFDASEFSFQTKWYIYAAFINVVLTLGLETSFFRFYTAEKEKTDVISTSFILMLFTGLIFLSVGWIFSTNISSYFKFENDHLLLLLIGVTVLDTLTVIPFALLRVTGRPIKFMLIKMANIAFLVSITLFVLLIIPYLLKNKSDIPSYLGFDERFQPQIIHIFLANLAASLLTFILLLPEIIKIKWRCEPTLVKKLLNYGIPVMIGGLAYVVNENADKLVIPSLISEKANGIYAACYKLGVFMTLYITAFRMGAEPFFFNHAATSNAKEKYSKIMTWFVILGCLFMTVIIAFIDPIAGLVLKQKVYLSGLAIVPLILLANLFSGIYINLSIWYKLTDRTYYGMYISIIGAILTIVSLYILVPKLGIYGGAAATLFTYGSMMLISGYLGHKHYPVHYEYVKLIGIITLAILCSFVSFTIFRGHILANITIIFIFVTIIYLIEKNEIKRLTSS